MGAAYEDASYMCMQSLLVLFFFSRCFLVSIANGAMDRGALCLLYTKTVKSSYQEARWISMRQVDAELTDLDD